MATIEKKQGKTGDSYKVWWSDRTGKRHAQTFKLRREADAFRRQREQELASGTHRPDGKRTTVRDLAGLYLEEVEARWQRGQKMARGTRKLINDVVRLHILPGEFGYMRIQDITTADVIRFHNRLWDITPRLSFSRIKTIRQTLCAMLEYGRGQNLLATNPAAGVNLVVPDGREQAPIQIPTHDQVKSLLIAAQNAQIKNGRGGGGRPDPLWYVMLLFTVVTGVRLGEMCGITWEDIDWKEQVIRVRQQRTAFKETKRPKSRAGIREIPVVDAELWRAMRIWRLHSKRREATDFIFTGLRGAAIVHDRHEERWRALQVSVGISGLHWHSLRHYCISNWLLANIPVITVAAWAGHSDATVTLRTYGHLIKRDTDKTVLEKLAEERATFMHQMK